MLVWGSIGVFVRGIELPSIGIALLRAVSASAFLGIVGIWLMGDESVHTIKKNIKLLIFSGIAMGFNWFFLFQAYKYTTISNATLSYYFAPVFITLLSPIFLREKLTFSKLFYVLCAMAGLYMILSSQPSSLPNMNFNHPLGIGYGLSGALMYAAIVLMNKNMKGSTGFETTLVQLSIASLVILPVALASTGITPFLSMSSKSWILMMTLGIVHTGIAYINFFSSIRDIDGPSIAILSYIDPISAVVIASLFLGESMSPLQMIGGAFILASTFFSQFDSIGSVISTVFKKKAVNQNP
ncbi:rarD protein [Peptoclostridium litorale DSM 5388]|uniref:EamA domain-containing protein n=2 Tax=Peptoclostridium litorale TaxID=1557 RepID=A0A069RRB5_PEPLI|nr:hypothetical protein CLIT_2c03280 [Peptoclostridium litorale DSM 5388]SIN67419.1 rarD protein [Peptoclostridium litorale DSM 5388]